MKIGDNMNPKGLEAPVLGEEWEKGRAPAIAHEEGNQEQSPGWGQLAQ